MSDKKYDLVVIGAGPGGYVAAIRGSQLGLKTAIIEAADLGGICLNWGCIPTKALLRSAEVKHLSEHGKDFGITIEGDIKHDWKKVIERSRTVSSKLTGGIAHLMKKNKVDVIKGWAELGGKKDNAFHIAVKSDSDTQTILSDKVIIATGATSRTLPGLEPDGKLIWTSREAMVADTQPKSLLVIGSGAIGIEFASFYNAMGTDVTVIEVLDRILPVEDEEISALAHKSFVKDGIKIHTSAKVLKLETSGDSVTATIEKEGKTATQTFDRALSAIGVVGNTDNIGLETTKAAVEKNQIETDLHCETAESGLYAIGDVAGAPWLAHKASHEGIIAAEHCAGKKKKHGMRKDTIPGCTYCHPQIASVGMTEAKAKEKGLDIKVGRFPFMANGKALALGDTTGLIKTIFDSKTGELLGAHLIGSEVTEMIQGFVIAKTAELTEEDLMHTVFPHPTLSEMMHESVLDSQDQVIHI